MASIYEDFLELCSMFLKIQKLEFKIRQLAKDYKGIKKLPKKLLRKIDELDYKDGYGLFILDDDVTHQGYVICLLNICMRIEPKRACAMSVLINENKEYMVLTAEEDHILNDVSVIAQRNARLNSFPLRFEVRKI